MGFEQSKFNNALHVRTGDQRGSSTDSDVFVILHDTSGKATEKILLDNFWKNDFKTGAHDTFNIHLPSPFAEVQKIEIWTERASIELTSSSWFIDVIKLVRRFRGKSVTFPVFRWIKPGIHYFLYPWDTFLPQKDPDQSQRADEILHKREDYKMKYTENFPVTCESLPVDEEFSPEYMWNILTHKLDVVLRGIYNRFTTGTWETLDDLTNVYNEEKLTAPESIKYWREDTWFGYQRLNGCNPTVIALCEEIPSKLGVDDELLAPVLKGKETLEGLIKKKRLFYTDMEILEGVTHKEGLDVCAPIGLFMLNSEDDLVPIAIQLQQQKGPDNPIFLPTDDNGVWTLAKMWYNLADASYHQSLVHLGLTHLLMEGIILAMHRNISVSHPIYKILAPHTLFLLAINSRGFRKLVSPGGWVDNTMTIGINGMFQLIYNGVQSWDFSIDGIPPREFAKRKVDDPKVLPKYYFRDDSLVLHDCIEKYVSSYIDLYYVYNKDVIEDWELQNWVECISKDAKDGGIGIKGLPINDDGKGQLSTKKELKTFITTVLLTCSVSHAHANFLQYEEYGFPANYPSLLRTPLLKDKNPRTEKDIIDSLPVKKTTLDIMAITSLLSEKTTNSLGHFETQYIYDPKALPCVKQFQKNLKTISENIKKRNMTLKKPYNVLDPVNIPNAISI